MSFLIYAPLVMAGLLLVACPKVGRVVCGILAFLVFLALAYVGVLIGPSIVKALWQGLFH